MKAFRVRIEQIGVNPFVFIPGQILRHIFKQAGKEKGPIPVQGALDGHPFHQTLLKYKGEWRLYLNGPIREKAGKQTGDRVDVQLEFNDSPLPTPENGMLIRRLNKERHLKKLFLSLPPSRQKEIHRYLNSLKSNEAIVRNMNKLMESLEKDSVYLGRKHR